MTSLAPNALPHTDLPLSKQSSLDLNPDKLILQSADSTDAQLVHINENTTKQQLIRQRNKVFLNNSNPHHPSSHTLIKFMLEKNLTFTGTDLRFY